MAAALVETDCCRVDVAIDLEEAVATLEAAERGTPTEPPMPVHVLVADLGLLGGGDDPQPLRRLRHRHPDTAIIVVTAYGTIESAVAAIKHGAADYLLHPVVDDELVVAVEKAARQARLTARCGRLERELDSRLGLEGMVGQDERMRIIADMVRSVAPTRTTVLMNGESGTGKTLLARAVHLRSRVADGPFVEIACGSIPETLLESELFGHVRGAFTGAVTDKIGRLLAADGGTLFLDEINSASPALQTKLLRVLQERRFEPVGSNETVEVDVRFVLATNEPLELLVAAGRFRPDLYYRINVVALDLPPLRDRPDDIVLLAEHFLTRCAEAADRPVAGFDAEALDALRRYAWPGNIRELENAIERAVVLCRRGRIGLDDLPDPVTSNRPPALGLGPARDAPATGRF